MVTQMKILSLNCRGLNDLREMKKLFLWLKDLDIDIICLQETFCTSKLQSIFDSCWKGHVAHSITDSAHSRGVAIMFKYDMNVNILNSHACKDGRKVMVNVRIGNDENNELAIVSVYAPNAQNSRKDFFRQLSTWISKYAANTENVLVAGDFNCCKCTNDREPQTDVNDSSRVALNNFMKYCKLKDMWCECKKDKGFTYFDKRTKTKSRLDYIMMTEKCKVCCKNMSLVKPVKGDHMAILMTATCQDKPKGPGYWKLNGSLLKEEGYRTEIIKVIESTCKEYRELKSKRILWEILKINIKESSINYSKQHKKKISKRECYLQERLDVLEDKINHQDCNMIYKEEHDKITNELREIYDRKVRGSQIRSKARWVEDGERSSKYFMGLEKQRQSNNVINRVKNLHDKIIEDDNEILGEIKSFYDKLYTTTNPNIQEINDYLESIEVSQLSTEDRELCEQDITKSEITGAVENLKENKSPGLDG